VDREKIRLKCEIRHPQELICFDESLLNPQEIRSTLRPGGQILVHAARPPEELMQALRGFRVAWLDAGAISGRLGLGHVINTTILGAYCRVNPSLGLEHAIGAIREMVPAKKEMNEEAARLGYEVVSLCLP
jgi:Pyruvate/2-oxoacid:ferredoxin oxidoreductase gamma subunit